MATPANGQQTTRPLAATMRGRIASRAHSFKENILEAFGHHGHHVGSHESQTNHSSPNIQLAKKTNSSDNLIGYSEPKQDTEAMVRDVQLSLRYFEDAVSKGTIEFLPGCATIVLERVSAIQAFICYDKQLKEDQRLKEVLYILYDAVSNLTDWADSVIVTGSISSYDGFQDSVTEPVRKAVIVLVNKANQIIVESSSPGKMNRVRVQMRKSLPDITNPDTNPEFPMSSTNYPPPLPPKHGSQRRKAKHHSSYYRSGQHGESLILDDGEESGQMSCGQVSCGQVDWFSNPLFENISSSSGSNFSSTHQRDHRHHQKFLPKRYSNSRYETSFIDTQLPSPHGLDTTLPESSSFPFMDEVTCPNQSYDKNNKCKKVHSHKSHCETSPSHVVRKQNPLFIYEPSKPVLPMKTIVHNTHSTHRKKSEYDNVFEPNQPGLVKSPLVNFLSSSQSFDFGTRSHLSSSEARTRDEMDNSSRSHVLSRKLVKDGGDPCDEIGGGGERRNSIGNAPPPLPPKKRDIINYMEVLGTSLLPSREVLMQSLAQTQLLLQNVWAENSHQFGEFVPDNSDFNFPPSRDLFTMNVDLSRLKNTSPGVTMKFPEFEDNVLHNSENSGLPPALPPKKNRKPQMPHHRTSTLFPNQFHMFNQQQLSGPSEPLKERIVPIVRETDGSVIQPADCGAVPKLTNGYAHSNRSHNNKLAIKRCSVESVESASTSNSGVSGCADESLEIENGCGCGSGCENCRNSAENLRTFSSQISMKSEEARDLREKLDQNDEHNNNHNISNNIININNNNINNKNKSNKSSLVNPDSVLNHLDPPIKKRLSYSNNADGIMELRAGDVDDLIVLATQSTNRDFVYQDAFLLTFRTFISCEDLLSKLEYRFRKFNLDGDARQLKAARGSFSLLVRVVDTLIDCDFEDPGVVSNLSGFVSELVKNGELLLARALRQKFIQKYELHRARLLPDLDFGRLNVVNYKPANLLQFKSTDLAEQITLLDSQYFWKLEPAELMVWVKEMNEEKSPNLAKFTSHFNSMSFWCRTKILQENDQKERERLVTKFIKVLKVLRKLNNFNSYLALLSALDSASIRRLDWPKNIVETLVDYSGIINFAGSFKAYREALSQSEPPIIPYMGLILQDLTFVHIGNPDAVNDKVNFAKRWQQYNILDNLRRFKREPYRIERKEEICQYFGNFENFLSENELWEISEKLKPRHTTTTTTITATTFTHKSEGGETTTINNINNLNKTV